ncbi:MAG: preprotein translocase subunit Sec61beta [Nitrososphaeria archaeon]|nr:preprotein translocase subunit Sec61beta [Nitrososphaeria archaeon]NIQ33832.1 preprotein translocase subunit Sec61beta [Nitrososphaeria archaeon]
MSRRRDGEAPMPAVTAGLLRFFEDSAAAGIMIQPIHVIGFSIIFTVISALLLVFPIIP